MNPVDTAPAEEEEPAEEESNGLAQDLCVVHGVAVVVVMDGACLRRRHSARGLYPTQFEAEMRSAAMAPPAAPSDT